MNNKGNILVVGGAGYIGSHMCKCLKKNGYTPIVLDNLSRGHRDAVKWGPFYKGSMDDKILLNNIFKQYGVMAVMHFAAFAYVDESVKDPCMYYKNNVAATINLLEAMIENDILNIVFSSSCATYGEPHETPIKENHPQNPINPYGKSKLMVEQILDDYKKAYGLNYISLRYFNAAGADPDREIGEDHIPEMHLIPLVLQTAAKIRESIQIFGNDYPTKDGTCIRDYIHVVDIANVHILALKKLLSSNSGGIYNLGNGEGYSVKEVVDLARVVTGQPIKEEYCERRLGDPAILVGSSARAQEVLGWKPKYADLSIILETAWEWHKKFPYGY